MEDNLLIKRTVYRTDGVDAINNNKFIQKEHLFIEERFDEHGNAIYKLEYDKKGRPERQVDAVYEKDRVIRQTITNCIDDIEETLVFDYDENQRLKHEFSVYGDEKILDESYEYYADGNIKTIRYYEDGEEDCTDEFTYDESGRQIKREQFIEGECVEIEALEYNESGEISRIIYAYSEYDEETDDFKNYNKIKTYEYDQKNRLIAEDYPDDGYRMTYVYDDNDRVVELDSYEGDALARKHLTKYNSHGDIAEEKYIHSANVAQEIYGGSGERNESYLLRYEYEYKE